MMDAFVIHWCWGQGGGTEENPLVQIMVHDAEGFEERGTSLDTEKKILPIIRWQDQQQQQ
jgi:hypothetical protein